MFKRLLLSSCTSQITLHCQYYIIIIASFETSGAHVPQVLSWNPNSNYVTAIIQYLLLIIPKPPLVSFQVTFIDQQHPDLPIAEPLAAVPRNFFPARPRVKLVEGYSDPKDNRASRSSRSTTASAANKPHRHHSQSTGHNSGHSGGGAVGGGTGQVSKGDFRNYSNLTAPVPKSRNKSRSGGEKGATKRNNRRKVSDSGKCAN